MAATATGLAGSHGEHCRGPERYRRQNGHGKGGVCAAGGMRTLSGILHRAPATRAAMHSVIQGRAPLEPGRHRCAPGASASTRHPALAVPDTVATAPGSISVAD